MARRTINCSSPQLFGRRAVLWGTLFLEKEKVPEKKIESAKIQDSQRET